MSVDADNMKNTKKKKSADKEQFHSIYTRLLEGIMEQFEIAVMYKILQDLESAYIGSCLETFESDNV